MACCQNPIVGLPAGMMDFAIPDRKLPYLKISLILGNKINKEEQL
jgi:hypothetical protein